MKRYQLIWLLILFGLLTMLPSMHQAQGKANDGPEIYLPFISTPAGNWVKAYQWGQNDRGGQTVGTLEINQDRFKLIGDEWVIYLKGDGSVDRAAFLTAGGDQVAPLSAGKYVVGAEEESDHCDMRAALISTEESTLWNKMVRLKGVDCGAGFKLRTGKNSILLQHLLGNHLGYSSWLVKLNDRGQLVWSKLIGQDWVTGPFAMIATENNGLVFAAVKSGDKNPVIAAELNSAGQLVRAIEIWPGSGTAFYNPTGIGRTAAGGIILTGANSENQGWALKLDKAWEIVWQKAYTLPGEAHLYEAAAAKDGGIILYGIREIVKIQPDGSAAWARSVGHGTAGIYLNNVVEAGDGGILAAASLQGPSSHFPLSIKLGPNGLIANCDLIRTETVSSEDLDLVMASAAVPMQDINSELMTLDPGYTGPIEVESRALCGAKGSAGCDQAQPLQEG